jgi:hypothetical protein
MVFAGDGSSSETSSAVDVPDANQPPLRLHAEPSLNFDSSSLISKPAGEVGCRSSDERDGYSLRDVLEWDEDFYLEVMVRISTFFEAIQP